MKNICKYIALFAAVIMLFSGCTKKQSETLPENADDGSVITLQMRQADSFNPLAVENHSVRDAYALCYEPLFAVGDNLKISGVLASSISVADDSKSAVIKLKDSVVWHDGVKFTSGDVVHTINLLKSNSTWAYSQCVKYIDSAQAVDALTLKINMSRPYGQIAYSLGFPIVAAHNSNIDEKMVGTGAYCFEKYTPATTLEYKSFDKWHGGEPTCAKINVNVIRDNETASTAFNTGLLSAITGESFDLENYTPKSNARITQYPSDEYEFMAFNHADGRIFSSQTLRSAVSSAIDRAAIAAECYGSNAMPANTPIHPGIMDMAASSIASQYSLANASELLFLEGYSLNESTGVLENEKGKKLSFNLLVNKENQSRVKTAEVLQEQLFAAGIEVKVTEKSFEDYLSQIESGNYDAYLGGTKLSNLYDFEFLLSDGGGLNSYGYSGEYMDLALSALASAPTEDALSNAVFNFEEVFSREQPICGLLFRTQVLISAENVMGKLMPQMNFPYKNISGWSIK